MAIMKTKRLQGAVMIQTPSGLVSTGEQTDVERKVIVRVVRVEGGKEKMTAITQQSSTDNLSSFGDASYDFTPDMEGDNFIRQAYLHLKTLPEFAEAEDC